MNIHYRVLQVDSAAHSILVRYFTDKVTENDLSTRFNEDGSPLMNGSGYPVATRTDTFLSIYQTPTPNTSEMDIFIMKNAPLEWLKLQEDIKEVSVDTSMNRIRTMVGVDRAFTQEEIDDIIKAEEAASTVVPTSMQIDNVHKAYGVINGLTDSFKILSKQDPEALNDLANSLKVISESAS